MKKLIVGLLVVFILSALLLRPPVSGGNVSSPFGIRTMHGELEFHTGTDIALPTGALINPTSWGRVISISYCGLAGNNVMISHLPGVTSWYQHMDRIDVTVGQRVTPNTIIGTVGNTGRSTACHLHFEIRIFRIPLPPYLLTFPGRLFKRIGGYRLKDSLFNIN